MGFMRCLLHSAIMSAEYEAALAMACAETAALKNVYFLASTKFFPFSETENLGSGHWG